jgi:hypothetical protein
LSTALPLIKSTIIWQGLYACPHDVIEEKKPHQEKMVKYSTFNLKCLSWQGLFTCCIGTFEDKQKTTFNEEKLSNALPLIKSNFSW